MIRSHLLVPLVVACALALPGGTHAQSNEAPLRSSVASLGDSAVVRVIAPGVYVDPGYFLGVRGDSLRLADADVELSVAFDEIRELAVRRNRWLKIGLAVGGIAAVFGTAAGFFFGTQDCGFDYNCGGDQMRGAVQWGGASAGIGFAIGAVVGSRLQSWRVVFP